MLFSVRVVESDTSYNTEIEAPSAEDPIRRLNEARDDSPFHFLFIGHFNRGGGKATTSRDRALQMVWPRAERRGSSVAATK
jgi:hypothetical protein